jgi:SAM-dependent MidA family methyltransferase
MRFSDYMEEWLYGEEGYYRKFREIGKGGDFYTAVSTSAFFGASIANELWRKIREGRVPRDAWLIEIGAHRGYLLADMIQWLYTCDPSLVETMRFATVERQPEVRRAQRDYFAERFGSGVRLEQFASLEEVSVPYAWYVSNEIFDAFPCDLYKEGRRAEVEGEAILWVEAEEELREFARRHGMVQGEIARGYEEFARRVVRSAEALEFVSFDYGERYVRNDFSIRIYRGHETLPLFDEALRLSEVYKEADITYDVNFGHVIEAFEGEGMALEHYETQARALVRYGLIEILERYARQASREQYLRQADRVKTLIAPTMMGDRFKVVQFSKDIVADEEAKNREPGNRATEELRNRATGN